MQTKNKQKNRKGEKKRKKEKEKSAGFVVCFTFINLFPFHFSKRNGELHLFPFQEKW